MYNNKWIIFFKSLEEFNSSCKPEEKRFNQFEDEGVEIMKSGK